MHVRAVTGGRRSRIRVRGATQETVFTVQEQGTASAAFARLGCSRPHSGCGLGPTAAVMLRPAD